MVFDAFLKWMQPDDVLLWWGRNAPSVFAGLMKIICGVKLENESHDIQDAFEYFVADGQRARGGVYQLAQARRIPLQTPPHVAFNDVRMMQALLKNVDFKPEWVNMPSMNKR